jgi:hypothetical protein
MTPQEFIAKWKKAQLSERSAAQQHFLDLCEVHNGFATHSRKLG